MPEAAPAILLAVADAAQAWWASKRPNGWTVEQHLSNPRVNTSTPKEKNLAMKVAVWVALQKGIPVESIH